MPKYIKPGQSKTDNFKSLGVAVIDKDYKPLHFAIVKLSRNGKFETNYETAPAV